MQVPITTRALWSWPAATVDGLGGRTVIASNGAGRPVLPLGVRRDPGWKRDPETSWTPDRLAVSLNDIHEELRTAVTEPDPASALVKLLRDYPVPELCSRHGLPVAHKRALNSDRRVTVCERDLIDGNAILYVDHLIDMVTGLAGIHELARWLTVQRRPASRRMTENALQWRVLPESVRTITRQEVERDGNLSVTRGRALVTSSVSSALTQARLEPSFEWNLRDRPELVLRADTGAAAYVADFASHVVGPSTAESLILECGNCGDRFEARRRTPDGVAFCGKDECRRARQRRNQSARRARLKETTHGQQEHR